MHYLSTEGMHKMSLRVPLCCLDLIQGEISPSDPKQNKPWKMVNFLKSVAGSVFNALSSAQSKTHRILGQKEGKGPTGEEGSVERDQFKRYFQNILSAFLLKLSLEELKT